MEAAEGVTAVPIAAVGRRVDGGGIEDQVVRVVSGGSVRRARPGVGVATGVVQSAIDRAEVASTEIPQRRKSGELTEVNIDRIWEV